MGVLADWQIIERAKKGMITPFVEKQISQGVISYGVSSYGYDFRVGYEFELFKTREELPNGVIDPKNFNPEIVKVFNVSDTGVFILPPHSFCLAKTIETFDIPRDVTVVVTGKSTYCRCGLILNISPLEASWKGVVTLELSNTTDLPAKVYAGEGIGQAVFHVGDAICEVSYADRKGKYQNQVDITHAKVKNGQSDTDKK